MNSVHESANTINFDANLQAAANRAAKTYPDECARIRRGLAIAESGGVELLADGTALVQSQTHEGMHYILNGHCSCPDYARAPGNRCKHRWAKSLHKAALAQDRRDMPPAKYWAEYHGREPLAVPGVAEFDTAKQAWWFIPEDGREPFYVAFQALVLGPNIALYDDQLKLDGNLADKWGSPQYAQIDLAAAKAELAAIKAKRQQYSQGW